MNIDRDYDAFMQLLAAEVEVRGKQPLSEGAMLIWWEAFCDHEFEVIKKAFRKHRLDAERGRFMPQPSDLVFHMDGTHTDRSAIAWGKALEAAQSVGAYADVVFDDPAIHAVVEDVGGWPKFCRTSTADLSYLQTQFCKSYQAYARSGDFEYPRRLTGDRSPDHDYLSKGIKPPKPVLIGNQQAARRVFLEGGAAGKTQITRNPERWIPLSKLPQSQLARA